MHLPRVLVAGLLLVSPLGARAQEGGLQDLARLVPRDAVGLAVLPSLDLAQRKLERVLSVIDEDLVRQVNLKGLLAKVVPDPALVDPTAPFAFAAILAADPTDEPIPALVLPVTDPAAFRASIGGRDVPTSGRHVLYVLGPDQAVGGDEPSALARDLPVADLVIRVDLERLVTAFRPLIEGALESGELAGGEPELALILAPFLDSLHALLDSAERLDLVLRAEGTQIDAEFFFLAKEGSPLASGPGNPPQLDRLARLLPSGYPLSCLVSYDVHSMVKWFEPMLNGFVEVMPEDQRERTAELFRKSLETYRHLGEDALICGGFGSRGFEMVWLSTAKDPRAYLEESLQYADSMHAFGVELRLLEGRRVQGIDVGRARMRIDYRTYMGEDLDQMPEEFVQKLWSKMFGPDGWMMQFASVKDLVVYSMGAGDAALDHMIAAALETKTSQAPANIQEIVRRAGGRPSFVLHVEFRAFLNGLLQLVGEVTGEHLPDLSGGAPVNLSVFTAREGRVHRLGLRFDLGALMAFLGELKEL